MAFSIRIDKEKKVHLHVLTEMEMLARTEEEIMHPLYVLEVPASFEAEPEGFPLRLRRRE